jgi:hypothetical protein
MSTPILVEAPIILSIHITKNTIAFERIEIQGKAKNFFTNQKFFLLF